MITSREVFEKRKAGLLIDALNMGRELVATDSNDPWNIKALAWTIIDLIKDASSNNDLSTVQALTSELNSLNLDSSDDVLMKSVNYIVRLTNPESKIIENAIILSKQGNHFESANAYRVALKSFPDDIHLNENLAWEIYKYAKSYFQGDNVLVWPAKKILAEYLKLKNPRPSVIHSLFLKLSDKLIGKEGFNLVAFLKLWDLANLSKEDFLPFKTDDGKVFASIAEKIIQHAAKDALSQKITEDMQFILPFLDESIKRFPENFWLIYYKAKLLHCLGLNREAKKISISVVKAKLNDYWAWDLLAETLIDEDKEKAFSCYCKALLCRGEDKFLANIRIKFVELLIQKSLYREAKYEIEQVIKSRLKEGWSLTEILFYHQNSEWYIGTNATKDNQVLYKQHAVIADTLLFDDLPWLNASLGSTFTTPTNPTKTKRKIFVSIANESIPIEISISEKRHPFKLMEPGSGLKIKGEYDIDKRFQIYLIEPRSESEKWDVFPELIGIIDHINYDKKLAHYIVDRNIGGVLHFTDHSMTFNIANIIALKIASHKKDRDTQYSVLSCMPTNQEINSSIVKKFKSCVNISNGLGFTVDDIFIDRPFVEHYNMHDSDIVEGLAVLNFNKKKGMWGWKTIEIYKHENYSEEAYKQR